MLDFATCSKPPHVVKRNSSTMRHPIWSEYDPWDAVVPQDEPGPDPHSPAAAKNERASERLSASQPRPSQLELVQRDDLELPRALAGEVQSQADFLERLGTGGCDPQRAGML